MMYHRVYTLTHGVSLLGLRPQDFVVILFSFIVGLNVIGALFPGYLRLVIAAAFIFLTFKVWQSLRDRVPDKYLLHLFRWLSEPEVYRAGADFKAIPLEVDPSTVREQRESFSPTTERLEPKQKEGALAHLA